MSDQGIRWTPWVNLKVMGRLRNVSQVRLPETSKVGKAEDQRQGNWEGSIDELEGRNRVGTFEPKSWLLKATLMMK